MVRRLSAEHNRKSFIIDEAFFLNIFFGREVYPDDNREALVGQQEKLHH
jgi:hypothetical protein